MPDTHYAITIPVASQIHLNGQIATTSRDTSRPKVLPDFTAISGPLFIKLKLSNASTTAASEDEQTIVKWLNHPQVLWHLFQLEFIIIMRTRRKLTGKIDDTPIFMDLRYEITSRNILDNIDGVTITWNTDLHTFTKHIDSAEVTEILSQSSESACQTILHDAHTYVARTRADRTADKQKTTLIDKLFGAKTYYIDIKCRIDNTYTQNKLLNETLTLIDSAYSAFYQSVITGNTADINDFIDTRLAQQISTLRDAGIALASLSRTNEGDLAKAYEAKDLALKNKLSGRSIVLAKLEEKLNPTLSRTSTSTSEITTRPLSRKTSLDPYRTDTRISPESLENHTYLTTYKATHGGDYMTEIMMAQISPSEISISIAYQYISPQELAEKYDYATPPTKVLFKIKPNESIEINPDAESYKLILKITRILIQTEICKYRANAKLTEIVLENEKQFYGLKDTSYITMQEQMLIKNKSIKVTLKKIERTIFELFLETHTTNISNERFVNVIDDINLDITNLRNSIHITQLLIQKLSGIFTKAQDNLSLDIDDLSDRIKVFKQELRQIIELNGIDLKEKHIFLTYFKRSPLSVASTINPPISSSSQAVSRERMHAEHVRDTNLLTPITQRELANFCPQLDSSSSSEDELSGHDSDAQPDVVDLSEVLNLLETTSPHKKPNIIEPDVINRAVDKIFSLEKDLFNHIRHLSLYKKDVSLNYEEWESTFFLIVNTLIYLQENFRLWISDFNSLLDEDVSLLPPMLINKVQSINEILLKIVDNCIVRIKCQMHVNMDITINAELISRLDSLGTLHEHSAHASSYTSTSASMFSSQSVTFTIDSSYSEQQLRRLQLSITRFQQSLVATTALYERYHQLQVISKPIIELYPSLTTKEQTYLQPFMAILGHIHENPQLLAMGYFPAEDESNLGDTAAILTNLLEKIQISLTPPVIDSFLATQGISCQYPQLLRSACKLFQILPTSHEDEIHLTSTITSISRLLMRLKQSDLFSKTTFDTLVKLIKAMSENYTLVNQVLQELEMIEARDLDATFYESLSLLMRNLRVGRVVSTIENQFNNMAAYNVNLVKKTSFKFEQLQSSLHRLTDFLWLFDHSLHDKVARIEQYFNQKTNEDQGLNHDTDYNAFEKLARALAAINNDKPTITETQSSLERSPKATKTFGEKIVQESCRDKSLGILRSASKNLDDLILMEDLAAVLLTIQQMTTHLNTKRETHSYIIQDTTLHHYAIPYLHIKLLTLASEALETSGYLPAGLALFARAIGVFDELIAFLAAKQALQATPDINPGQTGMPTQSSSSIPSPLASESSFMAESFLNFFNPEPQSSSSTESSGFQQNGINIRGINKDQFAQIIKMMAALQAQIEPGGLVRSRSSSTISRQNFHGASSLQSASTSSVPAASQGRQHPTRTSLASLPDTASKSSSSLLWLDVSQEDDTHSNGHNQRNGKTPHPRPDRSTTRGW